MRKTIFYQESRKAGKEVCLRSEPMPMEAAAAVKIGRIPVIGMKSRTWFRSSERIRYLDRRRKRQPKGIINENRLYVDTNWLG